MGKKIIINADDLGIAPGVNRGIVEAHLNGVLNSTSLMVNASFTEDAVRKVRQLPDLRVGLHISLIGGKPVCSAKELPTLTDQDGYFPKRGINLIWKLITGRVRLNDIAKEIRAQIELMKSFGFKIAHIDSHDHVHLFPPIMNIIIPLAKEFKISRIRIANQAIFVNRKLPQILKSNLLSFLSYYSKKGLVNNNISFCEHSWGFAESGNLDEKALTRIIHSLGEGVNEVFCHPGYVDKELLSIFPVVYHWEEELKALTSPKIKALIVDCGVELL